MKIIDYIKNLFKHKEINTNGVLVRPSDIIKIPKRKEFNNDSLVDSYKDKYNSILSTMKDYDPLIFEAEELNNNIIMTSKLLFNIAIKEEYKNEKSVEDRINYLINSEKLDLYKNDINNLQNEVIGRLIAISEIRKELFLSKKKKDAIDNIINRLCLSLNTLYSIEVSIINNIERYKNESKYNSEPSKEEKKKEYEIIDEKIKHLNWLQEILDSDSQINIRTDINYILKDIALIEKELEEYTYIHKGEITEESKNKEINNILEIPFDIEHKEELLKRIKEIEKKYRVFYEYREYQEYGELVIDESDLTNIYNLKFSALTISKDGIIEPFVNDETDKIEIEYYQNIIFSIIQDVIMGRNEYFNELFKGDIEEAIKLLTEYLKDEEKIINYEMIIKNFALLNTILAFHTKDGFNNFCNNVMLDCFFPSEKYLLWHQYLPISTVAILKHYNFNYMSGCALGVWPIIVLPNSFCDLYYLYKINNIDKDNYFYFPDGIKRISITNDIIANQIKANDLEERKVINAIIKDAEGKTLVFPDSLEEIDSFEIENHNIKGIVLNNNLKKLGSLALAGLPFEKINIPSSLESIDISSLQNWENLSTIQFDNFHKSELFKRENEQLQNLFYQFYQFIKMSYNLTKINKSLKKFIFAFDDMESIEVPASYFNVGHITNLFLQSLSVSESSEIINNKGKNFNALEYFANNFKKKFYELLLKRRDYFMKLQQVLPDSEQIHISSDPLELVEDIKLIEIKLKNYVTNNEDLEREIHNEINRSKEIALDKFNFLKIYEPLYSKQSTRFNTLKTNAPVFLKYSNINIVTEDDLLNLYYLKFIDLATYSLIDGNLAEPITIENTDEEDLKYLKKVVLKIVSDHPSKNNKFNYLINEILKDDENEVDPEKILSNFYLLNILLCLITPNIFGLFRNIEVLTNGTQLDDYVIFKFNRNIPIYSICDIYNYTKANYQTCITHNNVSFNIDKKFYELYNYFQYDYQDEKKLKEKKHYSYWDEDIDFFYGFPLGIIEININNYNDALKDEKTLLKKIREDAKDKFVVFPDSLQVIKGSVFGNVQTYAPIFDDGLTYILEEAFSSQDYKTLYFSSFIKTIDDNAFNFNKIEIIHIDNIPPDKITDLFFITKFFERVKVANSNTKYTLVTNLKKIVFNYTDLDLEITIDVQKLLEEGFCDISDTYLFEAILEKIKNIVIDNFEKDNVKKLKK